MHINVLLLRPQDYGGTDANLVLGQDCLALPR